MGGGRGGTIWARHFRLCRMIILYLARTQEDLKIKQRLYFECELWNICTFCHVAVDWHWRQRNLFQPVLVAEVWNWRQRNLFQPVLVTEVACCGSGICHFSLWLSVHCTPGFWLQVTGKFKGGLNPFHKGCCLNCSYVLCGPHWPKWVGWILCCHSSCILVILLSCLLWLS